MKLMMVTNTFTPHIGGVARSVTQFTDEFRRRGHQVLVVAPMFSGTAEDEVGVFRTRALKNFNGSDFSVVLPPRLILARVVDEFRPDIIHSHHPFLLGATAARLARSRRVPLVFTHHTLYERYTHYLPGDSAIMKRLAVRLSTRYANRSAGVFAPSQSVVEILRTRGVTAPILVVPTGVRLPDFDRRNDSEVRTAMGIPRDAIVLGYVGRLAQEKNLNFLARAAAQFLLVAPEAYALIVGDGPAKETLASIFWQGRVGDRVRFTGSLQSSNLVDAYHAMNVFAFASQCETQGLVLAEAMAAGVPVVALDGPGVREIVQDGKNGRLLPIADEITFRDALIWVVGRPADEATRLRLTSTATAKSFSLQAMADRALIGYQSLAAASLACSNDKDDERQLVLRHMAADWDLLPAAMEVSS